MPTESSRTIAQWGTEAFGDAASVKAYAIRAQEELTELIDAIETGEPDKNIALGGRGCHHITTPHNGHIGARALRRHCREDGD